MVGGSVRRRLIMVVAALAVLGVTFAAGRNSRPARVEERIVTQEVVKWQERVVVQEREVRVRDVQRSGRRSTRTVRLPDGTVTRETTEERASTISSASRTTTASTSTSVGAAERSSDAARSVTANAFKWGIGGMFGIDLRLRRTPFAAAYLTREVWGPLTVGAFVGTGLNVGLILGARF